jgi:hypothetical protein
MNKEHILYQTSYRLKIAKELPDTYIKITME